MDAIRMIGIVKCFGSVRVNDGVNLIVGRQEIHCLLDEDGAGKSTLTDILSGLYRPDAGEMFINEKKVAIANPNDAYALGIEMIHQHFILVNQLTVPKDVIMGKESGGLFLNRRESRKEVEELVERFRLKIDLQEKVVNPSVGMKQRMEILKTLYREVDIIILDEPTTVLTSQEVDGLFKTLRQLKENGKTIMLITHKLNETMSLSDCITVIRKGKVVFRCNTSSTNEKELATQMASKQVENIVAKRRQKTGQAVLELKSVRLHERAGEAVSPKIRVGEILDVAGVDGNGQQELGGMTAGNRRVREDEIFTSGVSVQNMVIKDRKAMGLGYIPPSRYKNAMIPSFSIIGNFLLGHRETPEYCRKGFIDYERLRQDVEKQVEEFEIKVVGMDQEIGQLSGGNQQKVILGREISHDPRSVAVAQPMRDLDIGAIERMHKTLLQLEEQRKAILLTSAESSEVINPNDRITVSCKGGVNARFDNGEHTKEEIRLFMTGKKQKVRARGMEQQ